MFLLFLCLSEFHSYSNSELQFSWQAPHGALSKARRRWVTSQERFRATGLPGQSPTATEALLTTYLDFGYRGHGSVILFQLITALSLKHAADGSTQRHTPTLMKV